MEDVIYTASANSQAGRRGRVSSPDGSFSLELSVPKEMGGPGGSGTNPEQLFAAGYSACFCTALSSAGRKMHADLRDATVSVDVALTRRSDTHGYRLMVTVSANIPHVEPADAEQLLAAADALCPYSDALRGNAVVSLRAT